MAKTKPRKRHRRSLLNLHLFEHMFQDKSVELVRRGVDARWSYKKEVSANQSGFNPPSGQIFYRAHSHIDRWLPHREGDTRKYNLEDSLIEEAMFLVHDHLHIWAYRWIQALCPDVGLGSGPITKSNFEALTFCHLLTEAVATVGLDYWYVCTFDLNDELDLGTTYDGATVSYHVNWEDEYRRFCPHFNAQHPSHLGMITKFYCTGVFPGFSLTDLKRSPRLIKWLSHELEYGVNQREYARLWLSYMSKEDIKLSPDRLKARVATSAPWQKRLVGQISELLWSKVKHRQPEVPPRTNRRAAWKLPLHKPVDFRFANWNQLQHRRSLGRMNLNLDDKVNFCFWFRQFVSQFDFAAVDPELLDIKMTLFTKGRYDLCDYFFHKNKRIPMHPKETEMLFMLN